MVRHWALFGSVVMGLAIGTLQHSVAEETADSMQPVKPQIVPLDLAEWQASVGIVPQSGPHRRYSRPRVEVSSAGAVVIKNRSDPELNQHIDVADAAELFGFLETALNAFYFTKSEGRVYGPSEADDAGDSKSYRVRVATGSRAVELELEQAQPSRMGFEPKVSSLIAAINRQLRQGGVQSQLPEPFKLDASYRDPGNHPPREVVPETLPRQWGVKIRIVSNTKTAEMDLLHTDANAFGLAPERNTEWLSINVDGERERHETSEKDLGPVYFHCARMILNEFQLRNPPSQKKSDVKIEVEMSHLHRGMRVEFECDEELPLEWRQTLSKTVEATNKLIKTGQKKIEVPWEGE